MGDLSAHFSSSEFACPDCGRALIVGRLLEALEQLRSLANGPIDVISGFRCPEHNSAVHGVSKSQHLDGTAADIRIVGRTLPEMYAMAQQVQDFRDGGIGIYDGGFIHVDVRGERARWARVKGDYMAIQKSGLLPFMDVGGEIAT